MDSKRQCWKGGVGGQLEGNCNRTDHPRQTFTHGGRERDQTRVCGGAKAHRICTYVAEWGEEVARRKKESREDHCPILFFFLPGLH